MTPKGAVNYCSSHLIRSRTPLTAFFQDIDSVTPDAVQKNFSLPVRINLCIPCHFPQRWVIFYLLGAVRLQCDKNCRRTVRPSDYLRPLFL